MHRTWCTKSYVTRGAQVLSHKTYILTLQYSTVQYITLQYITLPYSKVQYITSHYSTLQYSTVHYITLHYITLHYSTLHYIHAQDLVHKIVCHQRGTSPKSSEPTYMILHYITVQYSDNHVKLHYSIYRFTVQYITYMNRTKWCTQSYFTRGAQVLSHQNLHDLH